MVRPRVVLAGLVVVLCAGAADGPVPRCTGTMHHDRGRLEIPDEMRLDLGGCDYVQSGGETIVNGILDASGATVQLDGGMVKGHGTIVAARVEHQGACFSPGNSPGTIVIWGDYNMGSGSQYLEEIAGPPGGGLYDVLQVQGHLTLGGTLNIKIDPGYVPQFNDEFVIMTANSVTGNFNFVNSCLPASITTTPTSVKLRFPHTTGVVGDLNGDGLVNGADLGILLANWGSCALECCPGDLNGDGVVNGADLGILLGHWG